jgi:single-stranded DNA-binding protein
MDTEWHRITCFNGLGKTVAEHCEKGMKVWSTAASTTRSGPTRRG